MKYLFILGRNPELSLKELECYFGKDFEKISMKDNVVLAELKELKEKEISELGGIVSIGEVLSEGNVEEIKFELEKNILYFGTKNAMSYVLWNFSEDVEEIEDYLRVRFKSEKLRATQRRFSRDMTLQDGKKIEMISSQNLIDEQYFLFKEDKNYFGKIVQKCDYDEIEARDMKKPVRREALSISPRLSKIMINLSKVGKGKKLIDPFCGIGVILQEALLKEIKVVGIDISKSAIDSAKRNLEWGKFSGDNYKLISGDSKKIKVRGNVIVTEPDFGDLLHKVPTKEKANLFIKKYEDLVIRVLKNISKNVSGRIVFTSPFVKTMKGRVGVNFEKISESIGRKIVEGFPIKDFQKDKIVGREIIVLDK